jgi:cytochrome c-type biogenesis protein CcmH
MIQWIFLALALVLAPVCAYPVEAPPATDDPVIEARLHKLSTELRCLVCQNETLADSRAELANDLRREIRGMMKGGKSDREITEFLVSRYGDFVLYRPPVKATTLPLWIGPFVFLVAGVAIWFVLLKRRQRRAVDAPLSADEQRLAESLLKPRNHRNET